MKKITTLTLIFTLLFLAISPSGFCEKSGFVLVDENFNDFQDNSLPTQVYENWKIVNSQTGGSVVIDTDPLTNSKALKIISPEGTTNDTGIKIVFEPINNAKAKVDFKIRTQNNSARLSKLALSNDVSDQVSFIALREDLYCYSGKWQDYSCTNIKNNYKRFSIEVDLDNKVYDLSIDNIKKYSNVPFRSQGESISNFEIYVSSNINGLAPSWLGTDKGDSVYWIDDFKVEVIGLSVTDTMPSNNEENVNIDFPVIVNFNEIPNIESINYENVKVYKNEEEVDKSLYLLNVIDKNLNISFPKLLDYGCDYKIVLSKNIKTDINGCLPLTKDYIINYKTINLLTPPKNVQNNEKYSKVAPILPVIENTAIKATVNKNNEGEKEFISGTMLDEIGEYILRITAKNLLNEKVQTMVYTFSVVGEIAPVANNVTISTDKEKRVGGVLKGNYTYSDVNNDIEGNSIFQWSVSDKIDGSYKVIENAKSNEYTIQESDINKYFKFAVIPVSIRQPFMGIKVESLPFKSVFLPTATDLKISGTMKISEELSANYSYKDENDEPESNSVFKWYKSIDNGKTYTLIETQNKKTYQISQNDVNCLIKFSVTPCKGKDKIYGEECFSKEIKGLFKPLAKNVRIQGVATFGQSICAIYDFEDENGDKEKNSSIRWYLQNSQIHEGSSLSLTSDMIGKTLYAEVTPISENFPYNGEPLKSDSVTVGDSTPKPDTGTSGGSSVSTENKKDEPTFDKEKPTLPKDEPIKNNFLDISDHWAKNTIEKMAEKQIVNGENATMFFPDKTITRAEISAILSRAFKLENSDAKSFDDVKNDVWYSQYVKKVSSAGYMSGDGKNFRPNDYISREEIAVIVYKIAVKNGLEADVEKQITFLDKNEISTWAEKEVAFSYSLGIIKGISDETFSPRDYASKAQFLVMLERLMNCLEVNTNE